MSDVIQFPSQDALLDVSVVKELLAELAEAFPGGSRSKDVTNLLRVYRNNLAGVSEAAASGAVRAIIRNDERFPSVSRVRAAAHEWTRRNVASPEYQLRHDANRCQSCGQAFVLAKRWRPKKDDKGLFVLTPDRLAAVLEPYHRDVCGCHPASPYQPDRSINADLYTSAIMFVDTMPPLDSSQIRQQPATVRSVRRSTPAADSIASTVDREARQLTSGGVR